MHTRFEHSLGVMHVATMMFDDIWDRRASLLTEFGVTAGGRERSRTLVRLAALLHDVGHAPFSHAGEDLFPKNPDTGKPYKHEHYSASLIREKLKDVIDEHPANENVGISANDIAGVIEGKSTLKQQGLLWRQLISSQLDADRSDYLLRDSLHAGVQYGRYDLSRLIISMSVAQDPESDGPVLVVEEGGLHTAEALILARYMMFTQVYFHKVRVAYDRHIQEALKVMLTEKRGVPTFPLPNDAKELDEYLEWTDWRVLGMLQDGRGGENGESLRSRSHLRVVYQTDEVATAEQLELVSRLSEALISYEVYLGKSSGSWYKYPDNEIRILRENGLIAPLSELSMVVRGLRALNQVRVYVPPKHKTEASKIVSKLKEEA